MIGPLARRVWHGVAGATVLFMLAPLLLLTLFAFSASPLLSFPITGVTLSWFERLAGEAQFWPALRNSLIVTGAVGAGATIVGVMAALGLLRLRRRMSLALTTLCTLPVMLPPLMLGVVLLSFYAGLGLRMGLLTVILSHLVFTQPFVILIVGARLADFDQALVESARDLGARPVRAFFEVTLPIIAPSVIGAALIAMALSLDDFLVTFFTKGDANTLPIFMWGMLRKGIDPTINAIALILLALSLAVSLIGLRFARYRG